MEFAPEGPKAIPLWINGHARPQPRAFLALCETLGLDPVALAAEYEGQR